MATLEGAGFTLFQTYFQSIAALALSEQARHSEAAGMVEAALAHCLLSGERWCLPELYRVRAHIVLAAGGEGSPAGAAENLDLAATAAEEDGALAWSRRIDQDRRALDAAIGD
jgi:hypothetical protein